MTNVRRFMAPGPWITRDLKECVRASDYDALREAAWRVQCYRCKGRGHVMGAIGSDRIPCPDCAALRALLNHAPGRIITGIKYNRAPWGRGDLIFIPIGFFFPPEQAILDPDGSCVLSHKRIGENVEITLARSCGSILVRYLVLGSDFNEAHFGLLTSPLPPADAPRPEPSPSS